MSIVKNRMAVLRSLCVCHHRMLTASYFSDKTLTRKIFIWPLSFNCCYCVLWVVPSRYGSFLDIVYLTLYRGHGHVCTVWPFLCGYYRIIAIQCNAGAIALINSLGALGSFAGAKGVGYLNEVPAALMHLIFLWRVLYFFPPL
jgi:hypothetical protein